MKLLSSRICVDCEEIFDHIRTLQAATGNARICPSCTSTSTVLLSKWIQTMEEYEKNREEICDRIYADLSSLSHSSPALSQEK